MISQDDLEELTPEERRDLARRLAVLTAPPPIEAHPGRRHLFLAVVTGACIGLIPWILLLAVTSPPHYVAAHWTTTWVGFDAAELLALAATAYFAWKRRQALVLAAFIAGTLLVCDAWFDVTTARAGKRRDREHPGGASDRAAAGAGAVRHRHDPPADVAPPHRGVGRWRQHPAAARRAPVRGLAAA